MFYLINKENKEKEVRQEPRNITLKPLKVNYFQGLIFYGDRFGDHLKIIVPAGCSRQFLHYGMVQ